jgi:phosphopantetheinyl transferase
MVVAITTECEIGIDLELKKRNIINPLLIANRFFHKLEAKELNNSEDLLGTFMQIWVIKEAFVKMKGKGISYGFNVFHVDIKRSMILDYNEAYSYNIIEIESLAICALVPHFNKINIRYF